MEDRYDLCSKKLDNLIANWAKTSFEDRSLRDLIELSINFGGAFKIVETDAIANNLENTPEYQKIKSRFDAIQNRLYCEAEKRDRGF